MFLNSNPAICPISFGMCQARLVKLMPELMILVKGMLVACRSVFFTLILLLLITFVFSITFIEFSRGNETLEHEYFSSMGTSILTLKLGPQGLELYSFWIAV